MFLDKYSGAEVLLCYGDSIESMKWLKSCRDDILKLLAQYKDISLFTVGELTKMKNPRHPCRLHFMIRWERMPLLQSQWFLLLSSAIHE